MLAYLIDFGVLCLIWLAGWAIVVLSFFMLAPLMALAIPLAPLAYHTLMISVHPFRATVGQRMMGLKAVSAADGGDVHPLQALIATTLFYMTLSMTGGLLLLWCLFDARNRCLHDILSGTRIIRRDVLND